MGKSKHSRLIALILISAMVSGVGCKSKNRPRAKLNAASDAIDQAALDKAAADAAKALADKAAADAKAAEEKAAADKAAADKAAAESGDKDGLAAIDEKIKGLLEAPDQMTRAELVDGDSYQLESVATSLEYNSKDKAAKDRVVSFDQNSVLFETKENSKGEKEISGATLKDEKADLSAGTLTDKEVKDAGRELDLPVLFKVVVEAGELKLSREASSSANTVLTTTSDFTSNQDSFSTELGGNDKLAASVIAILNSGEAKEDDEKKEVITAVDENGKNIQLRLFHLGGDKLVIRVTFEEQGGDGATLIRNVFLTYVQQK